MHPNFDKWFYLDDGEDSQYFVVDSSNIIFFQGAGKNGYDEGIGIFVNKIKGESRSQTVCIMLDHTWCDKPLKEISFNEVPDEIKHFFEKAKRKLAKAKKWFETNYPNGI